MESEEEVARDKYWVSTEVPESCSVKRSHRSKIMNHIHLEFYLQFRECH